MKLNTFEQNKKGKRCLIFIPCFTVHRFVLRSCNVVHVFSIAETMGLNAQMFSTCSGDNMFFHIASYVKKKKHVKIM